MRMSARFVGNKVGMDTKWVYDLWEKMGVVIKDKSGDWILTKYGRSIGGKMSKSNYCPVPTFKFEILYLIFDYPHKHYTFKYFEV